MQEYVVSIYSKFDWEEEKSENIKKLQDAVKKWKVNFFDAATTLLSSFCIEYEANRRSISYTEHAGNFSQYLQQP